MADFLEFKLFLELKTMYSKYRNIKIWKRIKKLITLKAQSTVSLVCSFPKHNVILLLNALYILSD